jgi:tripartite-type tricarboxylate transporter receptor subunit TctC
MKLGAAILWLIVALGSLAMPISGSAQPADWPKKPVRLIVPLAPGGGFDITARLLARELEAKLGQPFIVENRPGGASVVGAQVIRHAAPDGYSLLFGASFMVSVTAVKKIDYDPTKDFTAINMVAGPVAVLVAGKDFPANSVQELIQLAKQSPDAITYGMFGVGSTSHLMMEHFQALAGIKVRQVPYNSSTAMLTDVAAGRVSLAVNTLDTVKPQLDSGTIKVLAVTTPERSRLAPGVPTMKEAGLPNYSFTTWFGILGPANLDMAIVNKLNENVSAILKDPAFMKKLTDVGLDIYNVGPTQFSEYIAEEVEMWKGIVKNANIVVE